MTKFVFKKGNKYGKGQKPGTATLKQRRLASERLKRKWSESREDMIAAVRAGMARPVVKAKLSIINSRHRRSMSDTHKAKISDALHGREPKNLRPFGTYNPKFNSKGGWLEISGRRIYMKSIWERNYARYLELLKVNGEIFDWDYEPKVFVFEGIKFGTRTYKPDFLISYPDGRRHWHEVKGWMNSVSMTKLKRMAKYFPNEVIVVVDGSTYRPLSRQMRDIIPGWEHDQNLTRLARAGTYSKAA
jgi:hypothetical protein